MKRLFKIIFITCPIVAVICLLLRLVYPQAIGLLALAAFAYFVLTLTQVIEFSTINPQKYPKFHRILAVLGCLVCLAALVYIGFIYNQ
ncbi:hypothetical protein QE450_001952 [Paenibacillus sp. SORGH_AS306]|uniref:Uncharacterized protein n=1 Tax=Paenibacillus kyungheensis TaxID=1452732 RepID=A0AAX3LW36_9BACL|nr:MULTISPECIES: hypothetical protein [Paenibacillus]MDQ1234454.1 hypothetical protein [Paenibacillus sp. SORGH_AS_0306]MDR6111500.1 hypothetical protein [Paenibacillus sp. SORGH_AS_0338]WCT54057.1 hypothetical protein PQ456_12660 [Paenibacillus kyungheensis]